MAQEAYLRAMGRQNHYQKFHLHIAISNRIWRGRDFPYLTGTSRQEVTARARGRARQHTEKDKCQALILAHYPLIGAYYISNVILFMLALGH